MAWVRKETVKNVRDALKTNFDKNTKFAVKGSNSISLTVNIKKSDLFREDENGSINHFWYETSDKYSKEQKEFIKKMIKVVREASEYFDESDPQSDYFHSAHYEHYGIEIK